MLIKSFIGGDVYKNKSRRACTQSGAGCICGSGVSNGVESMVLVPLGGSVSQRSAEGVCASATRGDSRQQSSVCSRLGCFTGPLDLITIDDDVAIQTGAYIQPTRWSGQYLHVGPIHLESGCKIGMRAAVANNVTVGSGTWITPFTPILSDVGSNEVWEGAPARLTGRCTELRRTAKACEYTTADLAARER